MVEVVVIVWVMIVFLGVNHREVFVKSKSTIVQVKLSLSARLPLIDTPAPPVLPSTCIACLPVAPGSSMNIALV